VHPRGRRRNASALKPRDATADQERLDRVITIERRAVRPVHIDSAFATELGMALGQEKVAGKGNEITAVPQLLDAL
jgi:hypothetical protein